MRFNSISLFLCLLFISPFSLFSQNFRWAIPLGGSGLDRGNAVALDGAGNVYATGYFVGTVDFDPGVGVLNLTSVGGDDIYVAKYTESGNLIWAINLGGPSSDQGLDIKIDGSGDLVLTGLFNGTVDFDPGVGVSNLTSAGSQDGFVCKLNSAGSFIWAKSLGGSTGDYCNKIAIDNSGNIYCTGNFSGTADMDPGAGVANLVSSGNDDVFVCKLNASGNYVWSKKVGGVDSEYGATIGIDGAGNVFFGGNFGNTVDFDPGVGVFNITSNGSDDGFIEKLDASGNFVWAKTWGGLSSDRLLALTVDGGGNIISTGDFYDTVDFDPGPGTSNLTSFGTKDIYVSKLSNAGNLVWIKQLGGTQADYGFAIASDALGFSYVSGEFWDVSDLDPGPAVQNFTSNGAADVFVVKLDAGGNYVRSMQFGGSGNERGRGIVVGPQSLVYSTGTFQTTTDFDPGVGVYNLTPIANYDGYVSLNQLCNPSFNSISPVACELYNSPSGNYVWNVSGVYSDTLLNAEGCDSVLTINLTVNSPTNATLNPVACANFTSPSGNFIWNTSGTYFDTIPNAAGCDSLLTINLTIQNTAGTLNATSCGQYTSPSGNHLWAFSGTFQDTIPNAAGCDSVLTINLTIIPLNIFLTLNSGTLTANPSGATYQWINCGGTAISGATSQTFSPQVSGSYAAIVTQNGCTDTSACQSIVIVSSAESNSAIVFKGYPNPTKGQIHLEWGAGHSNVTVSVRNALGQVIHPNAYLHDQGADLEIIGASGIYFVEIMAEDGQRGSIRIVKE